MSQWECHTVSMTLTTIKVPSDLRDVLKAQAHAHRRTLSEHLRVLADGEEKRDRFERLRQAIADNPPDEAYLFEANHWQSDEWS